MVYKQQKFISHSSRGWEVQDQGAGWFGSSSGSASWLSFDCILRCWKAERGCKSSCVSSYMGTNPTMRTPLSKAPSPNTITVGVRVSRYEFWGNINIQSIARCLAGWLIVLLPHHYSWWRFLFSKSIEGATRTIWLWAPQRQEPCMLYLSWHLQYTSSTTWTVAELIAWMTFV